MVRKVFPSKYVLLVLYLCRCCHYTLERLQNLSQLKTLSQYETDVKLRFRDKDANLSSLINIISRKSNPYKNDVQLEFTESKKL